MYAPQCFMEPMKKVQVEGHLMFAEPQDLFGNLDELCYVSNFTSRNTFTRFSGCRRRINNPQCLG